MPCSFPVLPVFPIFSLKFGALMQKVFMWLQIQLFFIPLHFTHKMGRGGGWGGLGHYVFIFLKYFVPDFALGYMHTTYIYAELCPLNLSLLL